ncbi:MAG TPA: protein kinase [Terriglobales bacterium]|nr:protein kinase [Terriglobales bacterium]
MAVPSSLVGQTLGRYRVSAQIGSGGMGVVYRATDPRLGRSVALKIVPEALRDPEHLARLEHEAQILASLNHPNIATIYGIEDVGQTCFLVLELIPGKTLEEFLESERPDVRTSLELCEQVADALAAAHSQGVIHRDLKPSNILVTPEQRVKVFDFGLGKSLSLVPAEASSVTVTTPVTPTREGTLLGTPMYMSPEQARGKPADKRSDLWAFGCILYETLVGKKVFGGDTVLDTVAQIASATPDWKALPPGTPEPVRRLLKRCLEKHPDQRLGDAAEAKAVLQKALDEMAISGRTRRPIFTAAGISLLAIVIAILALYWRHTHAPGVAPQVKLTQLTFAEGIEEDPALSADGKQLLYIAQAGGARKIFRKNLESGREEQLTHGDRDDLQPAWSPGGSRILFTRSNRADGKLQPGDVFGQYDDADVWALDLRNGTEYKLIENAFNPSYSPDSTRIAVDASWAGPRRIWILDNQGHNPQQATTDTSEAIVHLRPRWSADGQRIVFQNQERTKFDIRAVELASKRMVWVTNDQFLNIHPVWSRSGKFIYFSSYRSGGLNVWRVPVKEDGSPAGAPQQLTMGAGQDVELALAGNRNRLAFAILKQNADIWRLPVSPDTGMSTGPPQAVLATTREDSRGAWSPDGQSIAFNSDRSGDMNIWVHSFKDGSDRQLTRGPGGDFQANWSPDGKQIAFFSSRSGTPNIWILDVESGALQQLTKGNVDLNPFFSPDGNWIAYQSDRGGRLELWVMRPDGSDARQLTRTGITGHFARWTATGDGVIYRCPSCGGKPQTMQVKLQGGDPEPLVESAGGSHMSFSPDHSRIMDVVGHRVLWVSPVVGGKPEKIYEFSDPTIRIDYPVWSPDGKWILFDRFLPQGGDVWMMENFE